MLDPYSIAILLEKRGIHFVFKRIKLPSYTKDNILREYELPFASTNRFKMGWKYTEGRYWKVLRGITLE